MQDLQLYLKPESRAENIQFPARGRVVSEEKDALSKYQHSIF